MSAGNGGAEPSDRTFPDGPNESSNEEFLNERLNTLRERYSYEQLSELSAIRLGVLNPDEDGMSERDFLHQDFRELYERFPEDDSDYTWRRWALGEDFQGLAPLTIDQKQRIRNCHRECHRNLDRACQDALAREDLAGPLERFGSWLVEFADALTPVFGSKR